MAEPPAAAAPEAAPSAQDVLLATKLHMPRPQPGVVARPRLAEQLDEGLGRGLVLVCAPAGYGKTVLLAGWAECGPRSTPWPGRFRITGRPCSRAWITARPVTSVRPSAAPGPPSSPRAFTPSSASPDPVRGLARPDQEGRRVSPVQARRLA